MAFYEDVRDIADDLLAEFGQTLTLQRQVPTDYDPQTGETSGSPATEEFEGVVFPYEDRFINNTTILATDLKCFMQGSKSLRPMNGDSIVVPGGAFAGTYQIERVAPLAPGGVTVIYEAQLRK